MLKHPSHALGLALHVAYVIVYTLTRVSVVVVNVGVLTGEPVIVVTVFILVIYIHGIGQMVEWRPRYLRGLPFCLFLSARIFQAVHGIRRRCSPPKHTGSIPR